MLRLEHVIPHDGTIIVYITQSYMLNAKDEIVDLDTLDKYYRDDENCPYAESYTLAHIGGKDMYFVSQLHVDGGYVELRECLPAYQSKLVGEAAIPCDIAETDGYVLPIILRRENLYYVYAKDHILVLRVHCDNM